ncbi:MAG TPA: hypothetical protein VKG26_10605 [Bacteroidia bacterium]|nr:hypothetical protein [Bacteroidia bacterium]
MYKTRFNNFITGIIAGLLLPMLSLCCYWLWSFKFMNFIPQFFKFLLLGRVLSAVLSLCLIPNLGMFFLFINKEYYKTTRGILLSMLLYGFIIVALKTWVEYSWSD